MINVGIMGVGGIAGAHLAGYGKLLDKARLTAFCDRDPDRAAGKGRTIPMNIDNSGGVAVQVTPYTDYAAFLADPAVDMVDICLPTDLHAWAAIAALEAGKHVLCEKPMALTVEDCDRMIAAATANGRYLMVAQCLRFWGEYILLKDAVDSGRYGKVLSANFRRLGALPNWSMDGWMADEKRSGGALMDLHIHDADFIAYLFGMPKAVSSIGVVEEYGISYVNTHYFYDNAAAISGESSWFRPAKAGFGSSFQVYLEGAVINSNPLTIIPNDEDPIVPDQSAYFDAYTAEIAYFLDCVATNTPPQTVTPFDARESIRLIFAEAEAVRTGQRVAL